MTKNTKVRFTVKEAGDGSCFVFAEPRETKSTLQLSFTLKQGTNTAIAQALANSLNEAVESLTYE